MALLVLTPLAYRLWHLNQVVKVLESTDKALIDEIGNRLESSAGTYANSQQLGLTIAEDLNELRSALLLPPKDYSNFVQDTATDPSEEFDLKSSIYSELSAALEGNQLALRRTANEELFRKLATDFPTIFTSADLTLGALQSSEQNLSYTLNFKGQALGTLALDLAQAKFTLEIKYLQFTATDNGDDWQGSLQELAGQDFVAIETDAKNYTQAITDLDQYLASAEIQQVLNERRLSFEKQDPWPEKTILYLFKNTAAEEVARLETTARPLAFTLSTGFKASTLDELKPELLKLLQTLETASQSEKLAHEQLVLMEETFQEQAFQDYLADNHLKLAAKRDNPDRVYYDILQEDDTIFYSFALDKATLELLILDSKGQELKRLGSKKN